MYDMYPYDQPKLWILRETGAPMASGQRLEPTEMVLCAHHALHAMNLALVTSGYPPVNSPEEGAVVIQALLVLNEDPQASTLITEYEGEEPCMDCPTRNEEKGIA